MVHFMKNELFASEQFGFREKVPAFMQSSDVTDYIREKTQKKNDRASVFHSSPENVRHP